MSPVTMGEGLGSTRGTVGTRTLTRITDTGDVSAGSPLLVQTIAQLSTSQGHLDASNVMLQNDIVVRTGIDTVELIDYQTRPTKHAELEIFNSDTLVNPWEPELHVTRATHTLFIKDYSANGNVLKQSEFLDSIQMWKWVAVDVVAIVTHSRVYHWELHGGGSPALIFERKAPDTPVLAYLVSSDLMWSVLVTENERTVDNDVELYSAARQRSQRLSYSVVSLCDRPNLDDNGAVTGATTVLLALSEGDEPKIDTFPLGSTGNVTHRVARATCPLSIPAEAGRALSVHHLTTYDFGVIITHNAWVIVVRMSDGLRILAEAVDEIEGPIASSSQTGSVDVCTSNGDLISVGLDDHALKTHANFVVKDVQLTEQIVGRLLALEQNLGKVVLYAAGRGQHGQLGLGDDASRMTPYVVPCAGVGRVVQLTGGLSHSLLLSQSGQVYIAGSGSDGQLGFGDAQSGPFSEFTLLDKAAFGGENVRFIAAGGNHSAAVTESGSLYMWGANDRGQLGLSHVKEVNTPTLVTALESKQVQSVSCGAHHTVILTVSGDVYTTGGGSFGQLGHGSNLADRSHPACVSKLFGKRVVSVAAGGRHTVVATDEGHVYTWGEGRDGQLGTGEKKLQSTPQRVASLKGELVVACAAGEAHSLALAATGEVYSWGFGAKGQLGLKDNAGASSLSPRPISVLHSQRVTRIAASSHMSAAITLDGRLYTWGDGKDGRLANGDVRAQHIPGVVSALTSARVNHIGLGQGQILIAVAKTTLKGSSSTLSRTSSVASAIARPPRSLFDHLTMSAGDDDGARHSRQSTKTAPEFRVYLGKSRTTPDWESKVLFSRVYPRIAKACQSRHVVFKPVDLGGHGDSHPQRLAAGLDAVKCASPNVVFLFQNDYGDYQCPVSVPGDLDQGIQDQFSAAIRAYPWVSGFKDRSLFEVEVRAALSANSQAGTPSPMFFISPDVAESMPKSEQFEYLRRDDTVRLRRLQSLVEESESPPVLYTEESFASATYDALMNALNTQFPLEDRTDDLDFDSLCHNEFVHMINDVFVEDDAELNAVRSCLDEAHPTAPQVVSGDAGSGKSALLAHLCVEFWEKEKQYYRKYEGEDIPTTTAVPERSSENTISGPKATQSARILEDIDRTVNPPPPGIPLPPPALFIHFAEATAGACSLQNALVRFLSMLKDKFGLDREIPSDIGKLIDLVSVFIADVTVPEADGVRVIAIFDAVDVLTPDYGLAWLPATLPSWLNVIVSVTTPSASADILASREARTTVIAPLQRDRRIALYESYVEDGRFNEDELAALIDSDASAHPLLIRTGAALLTSREPHQVLELLRAPTPEPELEPEPESEPEPVVAKKGKAKRGTTPDKKRRGKEPEPEPEEPEEPEVPPVPPLPPADLHAQRVLGRVLSGRAQENPLLKPILCAVVLSRLSLSLFDLWLICSRKAEIPFSAVEEVLATCPDEVTQISGVYTLGNRQVRDAIYDTYLTEEEERDMHNSLAAFYMDQLPEQHAYLEAAYHLATAGNTGELATLLSSLTVLGLFSDEKHLPEFRERWEVAGGIRAACEAYVKAIAEATSIEIELEQPPPPPPVEEEVDTPRKSSAKGKGGDKGKKGKKTAEPEPEPEPEVPAGPTREELLLEQGKSAGEERLRDAVKQFGVLGRFAQACGANEEAQAVLQSALTLVSLCDDVSATATAKYDYGVLLVRVLGPAAIKAEEAAAEEQNTKGKKGGKAKKPKTPEGGKKPGKGKKAQAEDSEVDIPVPSLIEDGMQLLQQCVAIREDLLEAASSSDSKKDTARELARAYYWLGYSHMFRNSQEEALEAYQKCLQLRTDADGEDDPAVAETLNTIALLQQSQEAWSEALEIHTRVLGIRRRTMGSSHPAVAQTLASLGKVHSELEQHEDAKTVLQQSIALYDAALSQLSDKSLVAWPLLQLASTLIALDQREDASPVVQRAVDIRTEVLGAEHFLTLEAIETQGQVDGKGGKSKGKKGDKKK